jgi:hypothetical protein
MLQLDTDCYAPSTPPLSMSGSAVSSPPSSAEILPTPVQHTFFGHSGIESGKTECEQEQFSEILAGESWNNGVSPPMTPGTYFIARFPIMMMRCRETLLFVSKRSLHKI